MNKSRSKDAKYMFKPDIIKFTFQKKSLKGKIGMLDTLVNQGEDKNLERQYSLFIQEKKQPKNTHSVPPVRRPANIDTVRESVQKEITMLDTAANFHPGVDLPLPSFLSNHVSPSFYAEVKLRLKNDEMKMKSRKGTLAKSGDASKLEEAEQDKEDNGEIRIGKKTEALPLIKHNPSTTRKHKLFGNNPSIVLLSNLPVAAYLTPNHFLNNGNQSNSLNALPTIESISTDRVHAKGFTFESEIRPPNKRVLIYMRKHRNDRLPANLALVSRTIKYAVREPSIEKRPHLASPPKIRPRPLDVDSLPVYNPKPYKIEVKMGARDESTKKHNVFHSRSSSVSHAHGGGIKAINHWMPPINYGNKLG